MTPLNAARAMPPSVPMVADSQVMLKQRRNEATKLASRLAVRAVVEESEDDELWARGEDCEDEEDDDKPTSTVKATPTPVQNAVSQTPTSSGTKVTTPDNM